MDYLDPKKQARQRVLLFTGYICIAVAIVFATLILMYLAYGFGLNKNGAVIQNGLAFFSSQPHPANIYIDGKLNKAKTNSRLTLPSGIYDVKLTRDGYQPWQRQVELVGGQVRHFDYPMLFPSQLSTKKIDSYASAPQLASQSPDRRWLLVAQPANMQAFSLYDLKNPDKAAVAITLSDGLLTKPTGTESWQLVEWSDDNQHVLLQHTYDDKKEYILVDRNEPDQSVRLNTVLSLDPDQIQLNDRKYDQYYLYSQASGILQTASIKAPQPVAAVQDHVLSYKTYGDSEILYATDTGTAAGTVTIKLQVGAKTYTLRTVPSGTTYLLDLTKYGSSLYVAIGASSQDKVYIYKDPVGQLSDRPDHAMAISQILHVKQPNYLSFSTNAQFIMTENGNQFGVFDIENKEGYSYTTKQSLDPGVQHATWMDGDRLAYSSNGKLLVFDYDSTNARTLMGMSSAYLPDFDPVYSFVYTLAPDATTAGQVDLTQTSLFTPADQ